MTLVEAKAIQRRAEAEISDLSVDIVMEDRIGALGQHNAAETVGRFVFTELSTGA